jgi:hypothetical protein
MQDNGLKADFGFYPNPRHTIKFGLSVVHHRIFPGTARGLGNETLFNEFTLPHQECLESGVYAGNEQKLGSRLTVKYGLRFSLFQNLGRPLYFPTIRSTCRQIRQSTASVSPTIIIMHWSPGRG